MIISLVVAAAENNVIGKDNGLPWRLPNDLKFFKNTTWGMPVIMGRKTFESFKKNLSGRKNIVITRNKEWKEDGVTVVSNLDAAIAEAAATDAKEIFVIGGGEVFREVFPKANRVYLTRVHANVEGDAFFPEVRTPEWKMVSNHDWFKDEKHAFDYSFQVWERNR